MFDSGLMEDWRSKAKVTTFGFILVFFLSILPTTFADAQGFTVTSISTSDVITKSTNPSSVYWLVNVQLTGGGQSIVGTVGPQQFKSSMNGKVYTQQSLSIKVSTQDENAFYDVKNEGVPIYGYFVQILNASTDPSFGFETADAPPCPSGTDWDIPMARSNWPIEKIPRRFCIDMQQIGIKGAYENPTIGFTAQITAQVGSKSSVKTICSGAAPGCDGSSVNLDDLGVATWTGSLVTGDSPPSQNNYVAVKSLYDSKWRIASKPTFDTYSPYPATVQAGLNRIKTSIGTYGNDLSALQRANTDILNVVVPANQAALALINEDTSFTARPFSKDSNTGKVTIKLTRKLTSPNVLFRIRADWLGIVIPSGKPKILNVNSNTITSGEGGQTTIQIQNIGDAAGTFSAMLVGCDPFVQTVSSETVRNTIQPNDIATIIIPTSTGAVSEDTSTPCSVKVYDVNDPSAIDTATITLNSEIAKICSPSKEFVEGNTIKRCSADGKSIEEVSTCNNGITPDGHGNFICTPKPEEKKTYECVVDSDCGDLAYCNSQIHACVHKSSCLEIINNGDSSRKADIAFIGDGYSNNDELRTDILKIIDTGGTRNGMMSVEPFKSGAGKFNVWIIAAGDKIPTEASGFGKGVAPDRAKSLEIASQCTTADYKITVSKKGFRSFAYFSGDAYLSLAYTAQNEWGRLFLHEFGHAFGRLADEYVEPQLGNRAGMPNCAPNVEIAKQWWGTIAGTGFFTGCSYIDQNIRSTFNSIMRAHWILKDDFGPVNRIALSKILENYQ